MKYLMNLIKNAPYKTLSKREKIEGETIDH